MLSIKNIADTKAFTLIELMIVMAVIALLAVVSFIAVNPSKRIGDAKDAVRSSESISIKKAIEQAIAQDNTILEHITIPANQPYMLITENGDDSGTCDCDTLDRSIARVDIAGLFKSYFGDNIPRDEEATGDDTGYYILRTNNTFKVEACHATGDDFVASAPETITCYFDQYDAGGEQWSNVPETMVDNNIATGAQASFGEEGSVERLTHSTCASQTFGTITQVRIRYNGFCMFDSCGVTLRPVFGGTTDGNNHYQDASVGNGWRSWYDITSDTNAPGTWTTSDIANLDLDVEATKTSAPSNKIWRVFEVQLEVTHTP